MRTPEELGKYFLECNKKKAHSLSFKGFVEICQTEAYNQALDDVLEEQIWVGDMPAVFVEQVEKLKKYEKSSIGRSF